MAKDEWKQRPARPAPRGGSPVGRTDWRGKPKAGRPGGADAAAAGEHEWTRKKSYEGEKRLWIFRAKVATGGLMAVVLFGVLMWWLIRPGRTPLITAVLIEYKYPVAPNAWAFDDVENLRQTLGAKTTGDEPLSLDSRPAIAWNAKRDEWLTALEQQVRDAANTPWYRLDRGPGKGVVIVYLSAHGIVDEHGKACLLLPQRTASDNVLDARQRLPVEELLDRLFYDRQEKRERLPKDVTKLVILDASRLDATWELALPYNGFVEDLRTTVEQLPVSNLFVLNSASPGQIGWATPELGGSVFGFYVRRGLQGFADQAGFGNENHRVSVDELARYVRREVSTWVRQYRSDEQRPLLIAAKTSNDRVDLAYYGAAMLKQAEPDSDEVASRRKHDLAATERRWAELIRRGWTDHEKLAASGIRYHPLRWQMFQEKLLRLEQLALAGTAKDYEDQFNAGLLELDELKAAIAQGPRETELPNSLALGAALGAIDAAPADVEKLSRQFASADGAGTAGGDSSAKPGTKPGAAGETTASLAAASYAVRAQAVWKSVVKSPTQGNVERAVDTFLPVGEKGWKPDGDAVEIHFLRMLRRHLDARVWTQNPAAVGRAVTRRDEAEAAASPLDERIHDRLRPAVDRADNDRRLAEDALFVGRGEDLQRAAQNDQQAASRYAGSLALSKALSDAYTLRDRAWSQLGDMLRYHARRLPLRQASEQDDAQIRELVVLYRQIGEQLELFWRKADAEGSFRASDVADLAAGVKRLSNDFTGRRDKLRRAMSEIIQGTTDADRRLVHDVLSAPILTGEDRARMHASCLKLWTKYQFRELGTSDEETREEPPGASPRLRRIAAWTPHPALTLLGVKLGEAQANDWDTMVATSRAIHKRLVEVAKTLYLGSPTSVDPSADTAGRDLRGVLDDADRQLRSAATVFRHDPLPDPTPTERLRRYDRQRLLLWHCQRAVDDFWGPPPTSAPPGGGRNLLGGDRNLLGGDRASFFKEAANHLIRMAKNPDVGMSDPQFALRVDQLKTQIERREQAARSGLSPSFAIRELQVEPSTGGGQSVAKEHAVAIQTSRGKDIELPPGSAAYYLAERRGAARGPQLSIRELRRDGPAAEIGRLQHAVSPTAETGGNGSSRPYTILDIDKQLVRDPGGPLLQGVVLYRGHEFASDASVLQLTPYGSKRTMEYVPPRYDPSVVEIRGPHKRLAVMIVLDASGSMGKDVVTGRMTDVTQSRWDVATEVVQRVVQELLAARGEDDVELGLVVYGHRVRYDNDNPASKLDFARSAYADIKDRPPNDVERVVPRAKLTKGLGDEIGRKLQSLKPHGYTALYYSIHKTVREEFADLDPATWQRQIVVVTDGANVQCAIDPVIKNDPNVVVTPEILTATINAERVASKGSAIKINVVGFQFEDNTGETPRGWIYGKKSELKTLESSVGVTFTDVRAVGVERKDRLEELIESLRRTMGLFRYRITDLDRNRLADMRIAGASVEVATLSKLVAVGDGRKNLEVKFLNTQAIPAYPVGLRGGEATRLRINEVRRNIGQFELHLEQENDLKNEEAFRLGERKAPEVFDPATKHALRIRPHTAKWEGDSVRFFVAIEHENRRIFTPRPLEAMAIVRPFTDARLKPFDSQYTIHDVRFEPATSVPYLSFVVPKWPRDIREAEILLWFRFEATTPPDATIEVGQPNPTARMTVDRAAIEFRVKSEARGDNAFVVKVIEKHPNAASFDKGVDRIRVAMESQRSPTRIVRSYFTDANTVEHHFYYEGDNSLTLEKIDRFNVYLTPIDKLQTGAIHTPDGKPILVSIEPKP